MRIVSTKEYLSFTNTVGFVVISVLLYYSLIYIVQTILIILKSFFLSKRIPTFNQSFDTHSNDGPSDHNLAKAFHGPLVTKLSCDYYDEII